MNGHSDAKYARPRGTSDARMRTTPEMNSAYYGYSELEKLMRTGEELLTVSVT